MNKKHLPQIGKICYLTFKVSETETTEDLGYIEVSQMEDIVEDGFIDEYGNYFEYFFHIPSIDKCFDISQLVSWRDINGWISVNDKSPDMYYHEIYGKISDPLLLYGVHPEYNEVRVFVGFKCNDDFCSNDPDHEFDRCEKGKITHWKYLPEEPIE